MTYRNRILFLVIVSILVALLAWVAIDEVLARPGGGQSFNSGRSSGGSRSSGSRSSSSSSRSSSSRSGSSSSSSSGESGNPFVVIIILYIFGVLITAVCVDRGIRGIRGTDEEINRRYPKAWFRTIVSFLALFFGLIGIAALVYHFVAVIFHLFVAGIYLALMFGEQGASLSRLVSGPTFEARREAIEIEEKLLADFKVRDPNFSRVVFLDFASALFHQYHTYRGKPELNALRPFFSEAVFREAAQSKYAKTEVSEIVIGAMEMKISLLSQASSDFSDFLNGTDKIVVEFDANYTRTMHDLLSVRYVTLERWLFERQQGILSQPPEKMRNLSCPSCGAPTNFTDAGQCGYCGITLKGGEMQWVATKRTVSKFETFDTQALGTYAEEVGTDLPTVKQPGLDQMIARFQQRHNLTDWESYWNRFTTRLAEPFFHQIYDAWTRLQWHEVRHLVSDRLYESNNFWIEAYKQKHLINKLEQIAVERIELARVDLDHFYEAFTVRIFASCLDYTVNEQGQLIGGSKTKPREFSEYWTFIRRTGIEINEEEVNLATCPSCGASADKMGQAAECGYCGSKISTGEFSWVLAVITQDEVYEG